VYKAMKAIFQMECLLTIKVNPYADLQFIKLQLKRLNQVLPQKLKI
jgi:hypothetical protein